MSITEAPPTARLLAIAKEQARQAAARAARVTDEQAQRAAQAAAKIDAERAAEAQEAARKRAKEEAERRQFTEAQQAANEAAAEVQRLERQAILEDAEAAALADDALGANIYERAALAEANRPDPEDLATKAEQYAEQVLGVTIPAALWTVGGYGAGNGAWTTFLGGAWYFTDFVGDGPVLYLDAVSEPQEDPKYGRTGYVDRTPITSLADLGKVLVQFPRSLAPAPVEEAVEAGDNEDV